MGVILKKNFFMTQHPFCSAKIMDENVIVDDESVTHVSVICYVLDHSDSTKLTCNYKWYLAKDH